jgi:hypothetical protein
MVGDGRKGRSQIVHEQREIGTDDSGRRCDRRIDDFNTAADAGGDVEVRRSVGRDQRSSSAPMKATARA